MYEFHHWFWITLVTGVLCGLGSRDTPPRETLPDSEQAIVEQVTSFQPLRLGRVNEEQEGKVEEGQFLTERSVSVSKVRVEVGGKKLYNRKKNLRRKKKPKSLLDSLLSKLKSFAKVTLASRERKETEFPESSLKKSGDSQVNLKGGNKSILLNGTVHVNSDSDSKHSRQSDSDSHHSKQSDSGNKKTVTVSESYIDSHSYSDSSMQVISNISDPVPDNLKKVTNISGQNEGIVVVAGIGGNESVFDKKGRSKEARGRSLWGFDSGSQERVIEEDNEKERNSEDESNFSFSNDRTVNESPIAIEKEANIILEQESRIYLLEFSNIIVIVIAVGIFIVIAVVLTTTLLCRTHTKQVKSCQQAAEVSSNCSPLPQKSVISYNSEGSRSRQSCLSDELYSLDSDYFLSSLEDISAQV